MKNVWTELSRITVIMFLRILTVIGVLRIIVELPFFYFIPGLLALFVIVYFIFPKYLETN